MRDHIAMGSNYGGIQTSVAVDEKFVSYRIPGTLGRSATDLIMRWSNHMFSLNALEGKGE